VKHLVRLFTVVAVMATALLIPSAGSSPSSPASAANLAYFDPGNIISDVVFFDYRSMDAGAIQEFLNAKGANCTAGSLCLKNYTVATTNRAGDNQCAGYQGAGVESAATIIAKVAVSCRVSPRVLLVLLQKEMGLVTAISPTAKKYERAAGYACPDSANGGCDPAYAGLQNQLYRSAWQYKRYAAYPGSYNFKAGITNHILWHPNSGCGTSPVYIANQATAGLYNYTPYRPNHAALNAGYGTGDGCSSYGNRNFWNYFTDWFGSTQSPGGEAIVAAHAASGGDTGPLGEATGPIRCGLVAGGCVQAFQGGNIYWSPGSGAHAVVGGAIYDSWAAQRWEAGPLGYPTGAQHCGLVNGGCLQNFERGTMYNSAATGTHAVPKGAIGTYWAAQRWEAGPLGYPASDQRCGLVRGGCVQVFQGGTVYTSPASGTHIVTGGVIASYWAARQWEAGPLGYPIAAQRCGMAGGGCLQPFEGGTVYTTTGTGTHSVLRGAISGYWAVRQWEAGPLGYPVADQRCAADAECVQAFQGGTLTSSSAGTHTIRAGATADAWAAQGSENGPLGFTTAEQHCGLVNGGCLQSFQGGTMYTGTAAGTHAVLPGPISAYWATQRWEAGALGYPASSQRCGLVKGGCVQSFQGGTVYTSAASGTHTVPSGAISSYWAGLQSESGRLGYPVAGQFCGLTGGGCLQTFQGGTVYTSAASGTHTVARGPIANYWASQRWEGGPLGYPTGEERCGLADGGCVQAFQGGTVYWSAATGAQTLTAGPVADAWIAQGSENGPLGYPTGPQFCGLVEGGCLQGFEGGTMYSTTATGAHAVSGPIAAYWGTQRWEAGPLGYPVTDTYAVAGGTAQDFEGGRLVLNQSTGRVTQG
jgi:uncharacterized protein with LGFP repeats